MRYAQQQEIDAILEKMGRDTDLRYMACTDLSTILARDTFKFKDSAQEAAISRKLLDLLINDISGDVQTQAQQCLGPILRKLSEKQVKASVTSLATSLRDAQKNTQRGSASYGLKTVVKEVSDNQAHVLVDVLVPHLIETLEKSKDQPEVVFECLDVLNNVIESYVHLLTSPALYGPIKAAAIAHLHSGRNNNRKRATSCLAHLCPAMGSSDFKELVLYLVKEARASSNQESTRSCIQTIGLISKTAGFRLADCIDDVVPIVLACTEGEANLQADVCEDDDLREICYQTLESLLVRCGDAITPYVAKIVSLCKKDLKYDPNMAADSDHEAGSDLSDDGQDEAMFDVDDEAFAEFEDGDWDEGSDYSDDDDMSWKVRRAAAKTLAAVVATRPEMLANLLGDVGPVVVSRFLEREDTVKLDIFNIFLEMLRQTHKAFDLQDIKPSLQLRGLLPHLVQVSSKLLSELDGKTRQQNVRIKLFSVLKELVMVLDESLTDQLPSLLPGIVAALQDSRSNLKIEVLQFVRHLLTSHSPASFHDQVEDIVASVLACVTDSYYKIVAESLKVCLALVRVIEADSARFTVEISKLYHAVLPKLQAQDMDQEVKEAAIQCMACLLARLGNHLPAADIDASLQILLERLSNETIRLTAVRAIAEVAASPLGLDLSSIVKPTIEQITSFMRLNRRQLKQSSLTTLDVLLRNQKTVATECSVVILDQVSPLISDEDLHLSHLALCLLTTILITNPECAKTLKHGAFKAVLRLLESKVLQGLALESLLSLLKQIVKVGVSGFGFDTVFRAVSEVANKPGLAKQCYPSIAQCVGVLATTTSEKRRKSTVGKYLELCTSPAVKSRVLALLGLGEMGRRVSLKEFSGVEEAIIAAFSDKQEEVKAAASFALGSVAVGDLGRFLPTILSHMKEAAHQYLLLQSLREVVTRIDGSSELQDHSATILEVLTEHSSAAKDSVRNVVAECLGRLAVLEPKVMVEKLHDMAKQGSANEKCTVVTALKFAISDKKGLDAGSDESSAAVKMLAPQMPDFFELLKDEDLSVRRATLHTLTYVIHNRPILLLHLLPTLLPVVYTETEVKHEMIRKVRVGPFTHQVDDGLENRKAAYECMYTLLETCIARIDAAQFVERLIAGLKDDSPDIKTVCHIMLEHLADSSSSAVLVRALDQLVEPLRMTLTNKPKDNAVKQEKERYEELVRSALRAIAAVNRIQGVESSSKFTDFITQTCSEGAMGEKFRNVSSPRARDAMDIE